MNFENVVKDSIEGTCLPCKYKDPSPSPRTQVNIPGMVVTFDNHGNQLEESLRSPASLEWVGDFQACLKGGGELS